MCSTRPFLHVGTPTNFVCAVTVYDAAMCEQGVNMRKTEVMYQPCVHTTERSGNIQIEDQPLKNVSRLT